MVSGCDETDAVTGSKVGDVQGRLHSFNEDV